MRSASIGARRKVCRHNLKSILSDIGEIFLAICDSHHMRDYRKSLRQYDRSRDQQRKRDIPDPDRQLGKFVV